MPKQIKFKDGTVLVSYDKEIVESIDGFSQTYENACLLIKSPSYTTPNFSKRDLDGHLWSWNGNTLSISGGSFSRSLSISDYEAVIFNVVGSDNTLRGFNDFEFNGAYTNTHQWRGIDGIGDGVQLDQFISQYASGYYQCVNVKSDGSVQWLLKRTADSQMYSGVWSGYGGSGFTDDELKDYFPLSYSDYSDKDISDGTLLLSPTEFYYDGSEHTPTARVFDADGNELYYGTDWGISFSPDRTNPGQKIALAYGDGEYTGELTANWWILEGDDNPYSPGGESVPSTGPTDGTWDLPSDEIAPSGSIFSDLDAQLYRPYAMTAAQVASFSNQLWNTSILDVISRYFEKPTDVVIALMSYPFEVQSTETSAQIAFNWISDWSSLYVTGYPITDELQTLDFGYIDIERYSGTFYDYQPYSSVQLYLPYIGFVPLKMNEILGRRIYLKYIVDVITGDFSAIIETAWPDQSHEDETTIPVIATYQGNLAKALPLSQQDMFSIYKTAAHLALAGATAAAAGIAGFAAVGEAGEAAVAAESYEAMGESRLAAQAERRAEVAANHVRTARRKAASAGVNAMYAVGSANLPIIRNGNIDGISGRTSMQEAFVIISVPDQNIPDNQGILGYPTNLPGPLSNYAGYTEVRDIRIKSATATEAELAEIEQIVRGGIIV